MKHILAITALCVGLAAPAMAGQIADWSKVELTPAQQQCLTAFDESDYRYQQCRWNTVYLVERHEEFKRLDAEFGCVHAREQLANGGLVMSLTKALCDNRARIETIIAQELDLLHKKYGKPTE